MKESGCHTVSTTGNAEGLGGVAVADFAALDQLAVKLICLDGGFAAPLQQMGRVLGRRIASQQGGSLLTFEAALASMISACGLAGVIESRFFHCSEDGARLQISGCREALGWQVPQVERAVCGFDAGLFEGFLRCVTGKEAWTVEETACVGLGHSSCGFVIHIERVNDREGILHGR